MRKYEKEKKVKESRAIVELLIPSNEKSEAIYEAIVYIDQYDLPIKQNRSKEEIKRWITAVKDFMETIKKAESEVIKLTAEKLDTKYLGRYKALRNEVIRYKNAVNNTENTSSEEED